MNSSGDDYIVVVDLRGDRTELLRAILAPFGRVKIDAAGDQKVGRTAALIVDLPSHGFDPRAWVPIRERYPEVPTLFIGRGGIEPGAPVMGGALHPGRLRRAVRALLDAPSMPPTRPPLRLLAEILADEITLDEDDRALAERACVARVPLLLVGESGTGKYLFSQALSWRNGTVLTRWDVNDTKLPDRIAALPVGSTIFLTSLDAVGEAHESLLLRSLGQVEHGQHFLIASATGHPHGLRDDLLLKLSPLTIGFPALRNSADELPSRFAKLVTTLAAHYTIEAPRALHELDGEIRSYSWPNNFEELVAAASRVLFRASGRAAKVTDLGIKQSEPSRRSPTTSQVSPTPGNALFLERLVQELAHEIRNPLVSIKTFTHLLAERFEDPEFRGEYYRIVADDVDRIDGVLGELHNFSRLRAPTTSSVDLAELVRRALESQEFLFRKNSIEVVLEAPPPAPRIDTDPELLSYALESIVRQTLVAIHNAGRVDAAVLTEAKGCALVRFRVSPDLSDGPARTSTSHRRQVIGLGYALAAHVIETLGGNLTIEDTLEGTFDIALRLFVTPP